MRSIAHWSALYGLSVSCHAYKRQDGTKPWNTGLPGQRIIDASSSSCIQFPRRYCTDEGNQCNKGGNLDAVCILFLRIFFSTGHSSGIQLEATSPQFVCWTPASRVLVDQLEVRRRAHRETTSSQANAVFPRAIWTSRTAWIIRSRVIHNSICQRLNLTPMRGWCRKI